jgi:hypothetical protein
LSPISTAGWLPCCSRSRRSSGYSSGSTRSTSATTSALPNLRPSRVERLVSCNARVVVPERPEWWSSACLPPQWPTRSSDNIDSMPCPPRSIMALRDRAPPPLHPTPPPDCQLQDGGKARVPCADDLHGRAAWLRRQLCREPLQRLAAGRCRETCEGRARATLGGAIAASSVLPSVAGVKGAAHGTSSIPARQRHASRAESHAPRPAIACWATALQRGGPTHGSHFEGCAAGLQSQPAGQPGQGTASPGRTGR